MNLPWRSGIGADHTIESGNRQIIGDETERAVGVEAEGMADRRANRPAMGDRDNVASRMAVGQAVDSRHHARHQIGKSLAARR